MKNHKSVVTLLTSALVLGLIPVMTAMASSHEANASGTTGSIAFGTSKDSSSTTAVTLSALTTSSLSISSITSSKVYMPSSGYAARFGSGSAVGSLKFTFSSSRIISSVQIYSSLYGSDSGSILEVATSAHTSYVTNTISSTAFSAYDFPNLDNGASSASSSLTLATTSSGKRLYVSRIVVTFGGGSSSSSANSTSSSSWSSSISSSASSSTSSQTEAAGAYRIAPITSNSSAVNVYNVSYTSGLYKGTVVKTLTKGAVYTDPSDVSLYFQAFSALPKNYLHYTSSTLTSVKKTAYNTYGTSARLYTEYSRTNGYTTYFPTLNTYYYTEADIAVDSTYASSTTWNRGTGRLVIVPSGIAMYGNSPWIVKTIDHYEHFAEFYNYDSAFGSLFNGEGGTGYGAWVQPTTVIWTAA